MLYMHPFVCVRVRNVSTVRISPVPRRGRCPLDGICDRHHPLPQEFPCEFLLKRGLCKQERV